VWDYPERLRRLPPQYFATLLGRVSEAGADVVDLGRGNPEVGPPPHVVDALESAAGRPTAHGYAPFRGLPELKEAIAERYGTVYGVELDPGREVAVLPGTKTGLTIFAQAMVERGGSILLPDPGYPDYESAVAAAAAREERLPLGADGRPDWDAGPTPPATALYLNYPSNPAAVTAPDGVFDEAIDYAQRTGASVLHDFAYGDLVFDGRVPTSFLAADGARDVGVEFFSMSKSYGMAGWRLGFALGNAEIVRRIETFQDHLFAGIFRPVQEAGLAALTGPQNSVEERRAAYELRRDRTLPVLNGLDARSEGTFFVWFRLPAELPAERLLGQYGLAVAPGEGFGPSGAGRARISLAVTDNVLDEGLARLQTALADL
jgi:L-glutamine---4-(methylsulfanyl)-2-oxobutanoate aminotransferase